MNFRNPLRFALPAIALAMTLPAPLLAQAGSPPAAVAPADQPYSDLFNAILSGLDLDEMARLGADSIYDGMVRGDPSFAALAKREPELKGKFRGIATPFLLTWITRSNELRRPRVVEVLKARLTPGEAREVTAFYRSALGQKFMRYVSRNVSADNTVDAAIKSRSAKLDTAAVNADKDATVDNAMADLLPNLTEAEKRQLLAFAKTPVFGKMVGLSAALRSVPEPAFEEISTQAERDGFGKAVRELFASVMGKN